MSNLKEKLGARIQEIRKSKNITQEKLAELIDMDTPNLSNIERGKKFMTSDTLEKIAKELNVTEKELFDFEHIASNEELKSYIIEAIESLNNSELKYIFKSIKNLKQLRNNK